MPADRCCTEPGCRRKTPILLRRGDLSGHWYVITRYTRRDGGGIRATEKHALDEATSAALNAAFGHDDDPVDQP